MFGAKTDGVGQVGNAFTFSGASQCYVLTPPGGMNVGTGDFTVEGWVKASSSGTENRLLLSWATNYYTIDTNYPTLRLLASGGLLQLQPAAAAATGSFLDSTFHHFAVVRQAGILTY